MSEPNLGTLGSIPTDWWNQEKDGVAATLNVVVEQIQRHNSWMYDADKLHAEMYAGSASAGIALDDGRSYEYEPSNAPYNISHQAAATVLAKVVQHRPLPIVSNMVGDRKSYKKARKCTDMIAGEFYNLKIFEELGPLIARDALVFGRGELFMTRVGKKVVANRAFPWEVIEDRWDSRYGTPENRYYVRSVDKGRLIARYPHLKEQLEQATYVSPQYYEGESLTQNDSTVERLTVIDAFHRPTEDEEGELKGGRWVSSIYGDEIVLEDEEFNRPPPFIRLTYEDALAGNRPQGLVEQLEGFQDEINKMSDKVSAAHDLLGNTWILTPIGSEILDTEIVAGLGRVIKHKPGLEPKVVTPPIVHQQTYQRLRDLPGDALNQAGVSAMSAQSEKPKGIESGIALQTLDNVETLRFIVFGRAYEAWCCAVAEYLMLIKKEIAEEYGDYATLCPLDKGILKIKWKDVELDNYTIRVFPTSILPTQPAARLERLNYLFQQGLVDRSTFLRLLSAPDLQSEIDMETSAQMNVDEVLEYMRDLEGKDIDAKYIEPHPTQPLEWAQRRAVQLVNKMQMEGDAPENIALIRRFAVDCALLLNPSLGKQEPSAAVNAPVNPNSPVAPDVAPPGGGPPVPPPMPGGQPLPPPPDAIQAPPAPPAV